MLLLLPKNFPYTPTKLFSGKIVAISKNTEKTNPNK
jgi:hypothetical protein